MRRRFSNEKVSAESNSQDLEHWRCRRLLVPRFCWEESAGADN